MFYLMCIWYSHCLVVLGSSHDCQNRFETSQMFRVWNTLQQECLQIGGCVADFQYNLFASSVILEYLFL